MCKLLDLLNSVSGQDAETVRGLAPRFEALVLSEDPSPSQMKSIDQHPLGGDVVAFVVRPVNRSSAAAQRVLSLLDRASRPEPYTGKNKYPFATVGGQSLTHHELYR